MLAVSGASSAILTGLVRCLPEHEAILRLRRGETEPPAAERFLFCHGLLRPKAITEQSDEEIAESFLVNAGRLIRFCDRVLAENDEARICIIGSESGFAWSHDGAYAAAKAAVHRYVETKRLRTPSQQLVCVAPGIIEDAGMTLKRTDRDNLDRRRAQHPKRRFLAAIEVATLVYHLLYVDQGYLTGIVIRMNGGAHIS